MANDEFEDNGLDDYDDDFGDMDFGDSKPKDRSPAGIAKESVSESLKGVGKGGFKGISSLVAGGLPKATGVAQEAGQFGSSLVSMKNELLRDVEPTINVFKQIGTSLLPKTKRLLPKKLHDKLGDKLTVHSFGQQDKAKMLAEERDSKISSAMAEVFQAQETKRTAENEEQRTNEFITQRITEIQHKNTLSALNSVNNSLLGQENFNNTTYTAYLKKSLELKYRHLFVAKDTFSMIKLLTKVTEIKLEEIKHNTALPDIQKQNKLESLKISMREKASGGFTDFISNFGGNLLTNIKTQVVDKTKSALKDIASTGEMAIGMSDAMDGMGGEDPSKAAQAAGLGGSFLGKMLATKFGGKTFEKLAPILSQTETFADNFKAKGLLKLRDKQDSTEGPLGWLLNLLPKFQTEIDVEKKGLDNVLEATSFDNITKQTIVEIIPGFLSKILKGITDLAYGGDNEEVVFDPTSNDFTTASTLKENVLKSVIGDGDKRTRVVGSIVNTLSAAKSVNSPDDDLNYEDYKKDVTKVILNHGYHKQLLDIKKLETFLASDKTVSESKDYIKDVFKGIKDPKTVAQILVTSLKNNGKEDTYTIEKINSDIIEQMGDDSYRKLLPSILTNHGLNRHFKDFSNKGKLDSGIIIDQQMRTIDVDKDIVLDEDNKYGEHLVKQRAAMEALKAEAIAKKDQIKNVFTKKGAKEAAEQTKTYLKEQATKDIKKVATTIKNKPIKYFKDHTDKTPVVTYKEHKEELNKVILNHSDNHEFLDVAKLKAYVNNNEINSYTDNIFKGVKDPKLVTAMLLGAINNNDNISEDVVEALNLDIISKMESEDYRAIMPGITENEEYKKQVYKVATSTKKKSIKDHLSSTIKEITDNSEVTINEDGSLIINDNIVGPANKTSPNVSNRLNIPKLTSTTPIDSSSINKHIDDFKDLYEVTSEVGIENLSQLIKLNKTNLDETPIDISTIEQQDLTNTDLISSIDTFKDVYTTITTNTSTKLDTIIDLIKNTIALTETSIEVTKTNMSDFIKQQTEMFKSFDITTQFDSLKDYLTVSTETLLNLSAASGIPDITKSRFGSVGSSVIGAGKKVGIGVGKAASGIAGGYMSLYKTALKGVGSVAGGALNMGAAAMPGLTTMGNTALQGGFGLAQSGLNAYGSVLKGGMRGAGAILGSFGIGSKKSKQEPFFNVYLKDEVDPGNPLLSKRKQQSGLVFADGGKLKSSVDLTEPIFDPENKQALITQEDINKGLVDIDNNSIYSGGNLLGLGLLKKGKGLFKSGGNLLKNGLGILKGAGGIYGDIFSSALGLGTTALKSGGDLLSNLFGRKIDKNTVKWQDTVITRLNTIIKKMSSSGKLKGDADGDGDIDGSYQDQQNQLKERQENREGISNKGIISRTATMGSGALGLTSSLLGRKKNSEEENEPDSTLETAAKTGGGVLAYEVGKKVVKQAGKLGGKALVKMGMRSAATIAVTEGAALAAGTEAATVGGGLIASGAAALGAIPVVGWIGLGLVATAAGGYMLWKSFQPTPGAIKLAEARRAWYGIPETVDIDIILDMEERVTKTHPKDKGPITPNEIEDFADDLGIDYKDTTKMNKFNTWFVEKFQQSFASYCYYLGQVLNTPYEELNDINEDNDKFKRLSLALSRFMKTTTIKYFGTPFIEIATLKLKKRRKKSVDHNNKLLSSPKYSYGDLDTEKPESKEKKLKRIQATNSDAEAIQIVNKKKKDNQYNLRSIRERAGNKNSGNGWGNNTKLTPHSNKKNISEDELTKKTKAWIKGHEGLRLDNYLDSVDKPTIGYGHLNTEGYQKLTLQEADDLFEQDYAEHYLAASKIPEFNMLDPVRQAALINLTYNLGPVGFGKFKNTRRMLREGNFEGAANGLLNSLYAKQVKGRAREVAKVLKTGNPDDIKPKAVNGAPKGTKPYTPITASFTKSNRAVGVPSPTITTTPTLITSPTIKETTNDVQQVGRMAPSITTKTLTANATNRVDMTSKLQEANSYGKEQVSGLSTVADKIDSLKSLLSSIFGTGEVFNQMNDKLQATVDKEPVIINQQEEKTTQSNTTVVQQPITNKPLSSPTINTNKTRYTLQGVV